MVKQVSLSLIGIFLALSLSAQVGIGVRGGATFSTITYGEEVGIETGTRTGYVIGIPVELRLPGPLGIQIEANYTQFGSKFEVARGLATAIKLEEVTNYVNIPVLLKLGKVSERMEASVFAGPSFGYAFTRDRIEAGNTTQVDWRDGDTRANVGLVFGVQGGVPFGPGKVIADVRYNLGVNDVSGDTQFTDMNGSVIEADQKNRQFQVGVGYMFTFGG